MQSKWESADTVIERENVTRMGSCHTCHLLLSPCRGLRCLGFVMTTLFFSNDAGMGVWLHAGPRRQSLFFFSLPPSCPLLVFFSAESDFTHDAFCMSECRKEKEEREYYCYSEFGKWPQRHFVSGRINKWIHFKKAVSLNVTVSVRWSFSGILMVLISLLRSNN